MKNAPDFRLPFDLAHPISRQKLLGSIFYSKWISFAAFALKTQLLLG